MEMALYDPEEGYYSGQKALEDYYTSPASHPAFGAMLALQLEQIWEIMEKPVDFTLVEMGAGKGLLAEDILDFTSRWSPDFYRSLRYIAIERGGQQVSAASNQQSTASSKEEGSSQSKRQLIKSSFIPLKSITGCFLSNELLDSFPVHKVIKREGKMQEIYVAFEDGQFKEVLGEPSTNEIENYLQEQGTALEEGQRAEVNLEALKWMAEVGTVLKSGYIITIDYGHEGSQLYSRRFLQGTLLCYHGHSYTEDPYMRIGKQDITAHVNFTALMKEGVKCGLRTLGLTTQSPFLHNLGLEVFLRALGKQGLSQKEYYSNQMALRSLASPQGTGNFKVLIQGKAVEPVLPHGLNQDNDLLKNLKPEDIPVPLLKHRHLSLLKALYPEYYFQF